MKTSWNRCLEIEQFLGGKMNAKDSIRCHVKMVCDPIFSMQVKLQQKVYVIVRQYHRRRIKEELNSVHKQLFSCSNDFERSITTLFKH